MHEVLLLHNVLDPFPLTDVCARPQSDLVVLPAKVDKGYRKATFRVLHGNDGCVRHVLQKQCLLLRRCLGSGKLVGGRDKKELKGNGL